MNIFRYLSDIGKTLTDQSKFHFYNFYICLYAGREGTLHYYTGPQSFIITFSYSLAQQLWGLD